MIAEKLVELEGRIRAALAALGRAQEERAVLEGSVAALEAERDRLRAQVKDLESARAEAEGEVRRLRDEREAVRLRVDALLEEIGRVELGLGRPGP
jgi:chromosome segregation ATPase